MRRWNYRETGQADLWRILALVHILFGGLYVGKWNDEIVQLLERRLYFKFFVIRRCSIIAKFSGFRLFFVLFSSVIYPGCVHLATNPCPPMQLSEAVVYVNVIVYHLFSARDQINPMSHSGFYRKYSNPLCLMFTLFRDKEERNKIFDIKMVVPHI